MEITWAQFTESRINSRQASSFSALLFKIAEPASSALYKEQWNGAKIRDLIVMLLCFCIMEPFQGRISDKQETIETLTILEHPRKTEKWHSEDIFSLK